MSTPPRSDAKLEALLALGRRVRVLRQTLRLTQDEFAHRCGISVSFASLLERGERSPSYETVVEIARALEVPLAELFREGPAFDATEPSHARLFEFARKARLSRVQVERFIQVGYAMFSLAPPVSTVPRSKRTRVCHVEGCGNGVLARGLCSSHYHRARRARMS